MDPFIIDDEFQMLAPILSDSEYESLEESLFDKGCQDPLHIWNGILLDGHKRYGICRKWDIPFTTITHSFENRNEAIAWICENNIDRFPHHEEMSKFLIGKHYEAVKALFLLHCNPSEAVPKFRYRVAGELGLQYNIAAGTVYKYGMYTRGILKIYSMNAELGRKILNGEIKVSHENITLLSKYPSVRLKRLYDFITENKIDHICHSEIRQESLWINVSAHKKKVPPKQNIVKISTDLKIKQMPAYDPDAEVSSLTLTIPSWVSSIRRTQSMADLTHISINAKERLTSQLHSLADTINIMLQSIEEET